MLYSSLIKYMSCNEIWNVLKAVTYGSLLIVLIAWGVGLGAQSKMIAAMSWPFMFLSLSGLRVGLMVYWSKKNLEPKALKKRRAFIFGAGDAGHLAYSTLSLNKHSPFQVVGFIDDAPDKCGKRIKTLKVLGNRHHIEALARLYKVEEVIVTAPKANPNELNEVVKICQEAGLRYRLFSSLFDSDSQNKEVFPLRDLELQDILPTRIIRADREVVQDVLRDKNVLIHGSGNALGLELCHQILQLGCKKLIIVDRYESYLNELAVSLSSVFSQDLIMPVLVDNDGKETLEKVFQTYQPDIVFHASMRKYMPFLTVTGDDVVQANYVRTFNIAKLASKFNCEHFVMISSLMAAQSSNLVTDSLRVAEVSLEYFFDGTKTRLIIVRIGDIIENRGSIVSIIEEQIRKQQIVNLPSGKAEVHLMSKHSTIDIILQALAETKGMGSEKKLFIFSADNGLTP